MELEAPGFATTPPMGCLPRVPVKSHVVGEVGESRKRENIERLDVVDGIGGVRIECRLPTQWTDERRGRDAYLLSTELCYSFPSRWSIPSPHPQIVPHTRLCWQVRGVGATIKKGRYGCETSRNSPPCQTCVVESSC